ncbi:hypothetical protein ACMXYX_02770 [Neptuniibacter sp. QD72_48]|uniref:hypothetical protein n=1 Tax=Neptuniibacter sp. QD72_48 TaxID=3398214 RepID=UPI0039F5B2A4
MKILILGIDGLGVESLKGMGLLKLASFLERGQLVNPKIDNPVSRGWPEIYSGTSAYQSGAFYQIPVLKGGKIRATQKTGLNVVKAHVGDEKLLWAQLKKQGYKTGLYTIPTVLSKEDNCEFVFPATGAGQFKLSSDDTPIFPANLAGLANYSKSNLGFRIGRGAFVPKSASELEAWLRDHLSQYFSTLKWSLERVNVDALIAVSPFVKLYYKFRHIYENEVSDVEDVKLKAVLKKAAEDFDTEIINFIEYCSPEHTFIVSDHGLGELKYQVSVNEALRELGYIDYRSGINNLVINTAKKIRDKVKRRYSSYFPIFDLDNSMAFSIGYTDTIYINDARFNGPEMCEEKRYELASKISKELAELTSSKGIEQFLEFKAIKSSGWTDPVENNSDPIPLPDIRCVLAEGCVNLQRTNGNVVEKNEPYYAVEMYKKGFFAEHSGCKTNDTIAAYIGSDRKPFKPQSLTDLYIEILRVAGSTS